MHKHPTFLPAAFAAAILLGAGLSGAPGRADEAEPTVREIYVPFDDLDVLLEDQPQRVLLSREQYESLVEKARVVPEGRAPVAAVLLSADYVARVEPERAQLTGTLVVDVLEDGLHAVGLDVSGAGLRRATLDGQSAAIGRAENGPLRLFVEGKGRHELLLEMVAPLETTAATQVLNVRLPRPPSATLKLTVPGDVELKSGADVAARTVDEAAGVTRFELLPRRGDMTLVMTLNSRLARRQRAVVARSVVVDEVTEAYERIHATVSFRVLHQAVERFRLLVPDGFEVTELSSPLLARWQVEADAQGRVLDVRLREQTTETVVLTLSAVRTSGPSDDWAFPKLEPLDVLGQVAVLGLLVDERLKAESISPSGLIPIDTAVLHEAVPETVFKAEPGAPTLRSVVAYYAPQSQFDLSARFVRPAAEISVMTNVLLLLRDQDRQVRGEFFLSPEVEKLFGFDFSVPAAWHVTSVNTPEGAPLAFERYRVQEAAGRIHVSLPQGVLPGEEYRVYFNAESVPPEWLGKWESKEVEFPVFAVDRAARDVGAIAVEAPDGEMDVRLLAHQNLMPLDAAERQQYGLAESETTGRVLAYRYEAQPYQATLSVRRTRPRLTARTFSFLTVRSEALAAHYEIVYQVDEARTQSLSLLLPEATPADLSIEALDGVRLKQSTSSLTDGTRHWTALLEEPLKGTIRLAVDFQQPFPGQGQSGPELEMKDFPLPIIRAGGVDYQSGLVAVEGNAELEVQVATEARPVDVGELADARRQPGRGLLGVFGFLGDPPDVKIDAFRRPGYRLHPTIVERAELVTRLSAAGESVTVARFDLRTKAVYLEVELPPDAQLWAADLDEKPLKPQREGDHLLMSLPSASADAPRSLRIVYRMPLGSVGLAGDVEVPAPTLRLRADRQTEAVEVPIADLVWHLYPPPGYEVTRSDGTVVAEIERLEPAILTVAKAVCGLAFWHPSRVMAAREAARLPSPYYIQDDLQRFAVPSAGEESAPDGRLEHFLAGADEKVEKPEPDSLDLYMEESEERAGQQMLEADVDQPVQALGRPVEEGGKEERAGVELQESGVPYAPDRAALNGRVAPPAQPPAKPQVPQKPPAVVAGKPFAGFRVKGLRSLRIDLEEAPESDGAVTFQSLGVKPELVVRLANRPRFYSAAWTVALAVALAGLALTNRGAQAKFRFILAVILVGSLVPLIPRWEETAGPANMAVFAACLLVPYYLLAALLRWFVGLFRRRPKAPAAAAAATAIIVLVGAGLVPSAEAAEPQAERSPYVIQVVEPPEPVKVPADAIILPYDPESETGIRDADQLLVPYAKYVELWNLAYPDQKIQVEKPPAQYALAGASYTTRLEGDEYLLVEGRLEIDMYTEEPAAVPLGLTGGVLARAELDGKPARLSVPQVVAPNAQGQPAQQQPQQQAQGATGVPPVLGGHHGQDARATRPVVVLHVSGKGRHRLDLAVRVRLERRGGWRVAEGVLPAAPASSLSITVPQPETDVRLDKVVDRPSYETQEADERIETSLGPGGAVSIQWRAKVAEGQIDRTLTARTSAVLDVQEDGLRLVWQLDLEFRRSQREVFSVQVPEEYLVERVEGTNVRGWEVRRDAGRQTVEVSLLNAAVESERFTMHLWRGGAVGQGDLTQFDTPLVTVPDAALHTGRLVIRRSPLLDLRTVGKAGVMRTDLSDAPDGGSEPADPAQGSGGVGTEESPLGIRPYEAYRFAATPFSVSLAAAPLAGKTTAEVQTVLKIAEFERSLESQVNLHVEDRPVHQVEMFLPEGLDLEDVSAPGDFHWALTRGDQPSTGDRRPLLTIYLAAGQQGEVPIRIAGTLARQGATDPLPVPRLELLGVDRQQGQIAVGVDPAFDVEPADLEHCEKVLPSELFGWLNPEHREVTRLALAYDRPDYRGTLRFSLRKPDVTCATITNVRVTDRAVEETLLLDFTIEEAGIREIEFLLPDWLEQARIQVPMLRQKTIEPVDGREGAPLRVRLELQDDVMGELRVLVENDRVLTREAHAAPIPTVRTGRTLRQVVALQSAGRDEVVIDKGRLVGLEPLRRQQSEWAELQDVLGGITRAYVVARDAQQPRLVFQAKQRKAVQTAGARIGLAETNLAFDPTGAYRAEQIYRLDNTTEQFLVVELPGDARLWTVLVAGEPAKPTKVPGAKDSRLVRIPLVKTAPGDLDYAVVLKYGGKMPALGTWAAMRSSVSFPLVRSVNIKVELSQVRLYLPETYRWFHFGGKMRLVGDEEELTAGFFSYQTKVAERLMETMRQDNPYAQLRAAGNVKQLGQAIQSYHDTWEARGRGERLQEEYAKNVEVIQEAEQQLQQLEETAKEQTTFDNRYRLNTLFEGQKNTRARNVVQDLGPNWDRPADGQMPEVGQKPSQLNPAWLDANRLSTPSVEGKPDGTKRLPPREGDERRLERGRKAPAPEQGRFRGTRFQEGKAAPEDGKPSTPRGEEGARREERSTELRFGGGYGYGLGQSDAQGMVRQDGTGRSRSRHYAIVTDGSDSMLSGSVDVGEDFVVAGRHRFDTGGGAGLGGQPGGPAVDTGLPAGLASVDVQLPVRGVVYRFTTPGGDVEITARAVPGKLISGLIYAALILATVLLVLYVVRLARRGGFNWLASRAGSWCLILIGLMTLVILPVIGLVMLVSGIVIKVRRVISRSSTPVASDAQRELVTPEVVPE